MNDLISRQAALDALGERPVVWSDNDDYTLGERNQYDMDRLAIETVPSAQPVVISKSENATECEDAVSRFEVLRLIDYSSHDLNDAVDNRYMQNEIKQLPPVTPKQPGWIPCSTEMPPTGKNVLVTLVDGAVTDGERWKPQEGKWFLFSDGVNGLDEDVLAWMPLPAPYCPEGDDKHEG